MSTASPSLKDFPFASPTTVPNVGLNNSPALAYYNDTIYMAWCGTGKNDTNIFYSSWSQENGAWAPQAIAGNFGINGSPALVELGGNLCMVWRGDGSGDSSIWFATFNGTSWSSQQQVVSNASFTNSAPALCAFSSTSTSTPDVLMLAYLADPNDTPGQGSGGIFYCLYTEAKGWGAPSAVSFTGAVGQPSLALLNGKIFMAWPGCAPDTGFIWYSQGTFDAATSTISWSAQEQAMCGGDIFRTLNSAVSLASIGPDQLLMVWGTAPFFWSVCSANSARDVVWSAAEIAVDLPSIPSSPSNPSPALLPTSNETTLMAYGAGNGSSIMTTSAPNSKFGQIVKNQTLPWAEVNVDWNTVLPEGVPLSSTPTMGAFVPFPNAAPYFPLTSGEDLPSSAFAPAPSSLNAAPPQDQEQVYLGYAPFVFAMNGYTFRVVGFLSAYWKALGTRTVSSAETTSDSDTITYTIGTSHASTFNIEGGVTFKLPLGIKLSFSMGESWTTTVEEEEQTQQSSSASFTAVNGQDTLYWFWQLMVVSTFVGQGANDTGLAVVPYLAQSVSAAPNPKPPVATSFPDSPPPSSAS